MSGHSKWSTIKHKKAKEDAKRGKIFTKLIREITAAARAGGPDPDGNPRLRLILEKSKAVNMPQDNITRAIKKGAGETDGAHYENHTYEGYGPFGTAVIVETLSDNKNRTVADLRHVFTKSGGKMAESGAVAHMFDHTGVVRAMGSQSEDEVLEKLLDCDIADLAKHEEEFQITCAPHDLEVVKKAAEKAGLKVEGAGMEWVAKASVALTAADQEEQAIKFLEALEDLDDVQNVYSNLG